MSQTATPPATEPQAVPPDPILKKSYSVPIVLAMVAVVGATVLAVADEMWMRRPYKKIQAQYREVYADYLDRVEAKRRHFVSNVLDNVAEYTALKTKVGEAEQATAQARREADAALRTVKQQSRKLGEALKVSKSEISALSYQAEDAAHADGKANPAESEHARPILEKVAKIEQREITYSWPVYDPADPNKVLREESETAQVKALVVKALDLETQKATLQTRLGEVSAPVAEASKARDEWMARNRADLKHALADADDATRKAIADAGLVRYLDESVVALKPDDIGAMRKAVEDSKPIAGWSFMGGDIKQIHVKDAANWVDRCETCHLNARSPMPVTEASLRATLGAPLKVGNEEWAAWTEKELNSKPLGLFTSHPNVALLKTHDPDRFGCSMCHNGNGVAVTSKHIAHGENHHWLWPLYPKENIEAGCVQCHQQDLVLPMGERVSAGKEHFRRQGCWGCHKYEGFNREPDRITSLEGRRREIEKAKKDKELRFRNLQPLFSALPEDSPTDAHKALKEKEQQALRQDIAALETELDEVEKGLHETSVERQRVGPNLKDVKIKLQRGFLTDWIKNPRDAHKDPSGRPFRPDTRMPTFRWDGDEELKDAAAFIWQSALDPKDFEEYRLPEFVAGDAKRGEELFNQRGCLSCHSMGRGDAKVGNDFATNLSDLGEKNRPAYVARWVNHPRERLVAYDPAGKLGERDVKGEKPPEGGPAAQSKFVWSQHVVMPNFRLPEDEVRDITSFLVGQKRGDVRYDEQSSWLDDTSRFDRGRKIVLFQGCAGCHEIKGLEDEKGIGTELTKEGSKPRDQLDFGHHTIAAERGEEPLKDGRGLLEDTAKLFKEDSHWYRPRGFFLHKIAKPDFFDESKFLPDRYTRLRMPQFRFDAQDVLDVTTFVLGSVETQVPQSFRYNPDDAGKAIREGWWVVKKYNCQGCHQIEPKDEPGLWKTPYFAAKMKETNGRDLNLPPSLVGVGFRLQPQFLAEFLRDPSLGGGRRIPASVRAHLAVRMPTFDFSEDEIRKLVLFFGALAKQPPVYQASDFMPPTEAELRAASAIWKAQGSCNTCHPVAGSTLTPDIKAPNLSFAARRLRPEWMKRWIADPPAMHPGTSMTIQFGWMEDGKLVQPGPDRPARKGVTWRYMSEKDMPEVRDIPADHIELMIRYLRAGHAGK